MASETLETDNFLAMIANKIALLQALADSYRAARDGGALGQPDPEAFQLAPAARMPSNTPIELPTGAFRGKGIRAAIKMYLQAAKRKQPLKDIATALKDGGLESTSTNFEKILNTTLHQLKKDGTVLQFKEGWDLADAYPESFRQRLANNKGTATANGKKRKLGGKAKARSKASGKKKVDVAPKLAIKPKKAETSTPASGAASAA